MFVGIGYTDAENEATGSLGGASSVDIVAPLQITPNACESSLNCPIMAGAATIYSETIKIPHYDTPVRC